MTIYRFPVRFQRLEGLTAVDDEDGVPLLRWATSLHWPLGAIMLVHLGREALPLAPWMVDKVRTWRNRLGTGVFRVYSISQSASMIIVAWNNYNIMGSNKHLSHHLSLFKRQQK